jgi:hypothetical protein
MKNIFLAMSLLLFSSVAFATPVGGKIFYEIPGANRVAVRDVSLDVPARGQGEVVLRGKGFEWRSDKFWTVKNDGQTIFYVAFQTEFEEHKATILFRGTYLKGSNLILYYGDFYKKSGHDFVNRDISDFKYKGGFKFDYIR